MRYYIIAGEASGDLHAAHLIEALKERDKNCEFRFFGGDLMAKAAGNDPIVHYREMAYMGIFSVLINLNSLIKKIKFCQKDIIEFSPDMLILVDYPGFNLKIAKYIKTNTSIPVCYYILPKLWASRPGRLETLKSNTDLRLSILPFEEDYFASRDCPVHYVGNPTKEEVDSYVDSRMRDGVMKRSECIALLPGSRKSEIKENLSVMMKAIEDEGEFHVEIAGAPGIDPQFYDSIVACANRKAVSIRFGKTYEILYNAKIALVTSGTATLETGLFEVPQIVCYKTGTPRLASLLFKYIVHVPYISLINLIGGYKIVDELIGKSVTEERLRTLFKDLLNPMKRSEMLVGYQDVRSRLGDLKAAEEATKAITDFLAKNNQES